MTTTPESGEQSIGFDMVESFRAHLIQRLTYVPWKEHDAEGTTVKVKGRERNVPLSHIYNLNEIYLHKGAPGTRGKVFYVVRHDDTDPETIYVQEQRPPTPKRPKVVAIRNEFGAELDGNRVHVGISSAPRPKEKAVLALSSGRVISSDGVAEIVAVPFWRSDFRVHVGARQRWDGERVLEQINRPMIYGTKVYSLEGRFAPKTLLVDAYKVGEWFHWVLNAEVSAALTADSPYAEIPYPYGCELIYDNPAVSGWTSIVEDYDPKHPTDKAIWWEHVGDYDVPDVGWDFGDPLPPQPTPDEE